MSTAERGGIGPMRGKVELGTRRPWLDYLLMAVFLVPMIVLILALLPLAFLAEWFELFGKAPERERHTLSGRV